MKKQVDHLIRLKVVVYHMLWHKAEGKTNERKQKMKEEHNVYCVMVKRAGKYSQHDA
jgi:hypothetical protein